MLKLIELLRGIDLPPGLVGTLRGAVEAIVLFAIVTFAAAVISLDWGAREAIVGPLVFWAFRTLEGIADQIDPAKKRGTGELPPGGPFP